MISNEGSSSNSTSATSGAPEPALSASEILTYSGLPAPTSSWVTQMLGWVLLNSFTARPKPGTQAQKVIFVALEDLHELPATRVVPVLGAAAALLWTSRPSAAGVDEPLLPQPASTAMAVAPISSAAPRLAREAGS